MSTVTTASLVPALGALSTALFPLVLTFGALAAAAGGLAAAFGAVVGSGLIAFGRERGEQNAERLAEVRQRIRELENLEDQTGSLTQAQREELRNLEETADKLEDQTSVMGGLESAIQDVVAEIRPLIVEFGERFVPLIEDAIDAIPGLVENILDAVGPLDSFKNALRDAGNAASNVLPDIVTALIDLGRRALPAARRLGNFLLNRGSQAFNTMISVADEFDRQLINLTNSIIGLLPKLTRMGVVMLNTLLPPLERGVNTLGQLITKFNQLDARTKGILASAGALVPVIAGLVSLLGGPLTLAVGAVTLAVAGLVAGLKAIETAFEDNFLGIRDRFERLEPAIGRVVTAVQDLVREFREGLDFERINDRINEFIETFRPLSNEAVPQVIDLIDNLSDALRDNKQFFRELGEVATTVIVGLIDLFAILTKGVFFFAENVAIPFLNGVIDIIDVLLDKFTTLLQAFQQIRQGNFEAAAQTVIPTTAGESRAARQARQQRESATEEITLNIEGEGALPELIREEANLVVQDQDRRSRRRSGTTANLNR
jgi:phage-related protein